MQLTFSEDPQRVPPLLWHRGLRAPYNSTNLLSFRLARPFSFFTSWPLGP